MSTVHFPLSTVPTYRERPPRSRLMRLIIAGVIWASVVGSALAAPPEVRVTRVPESGLQPLVAAGADGTVHLVYFKGNAGGGDLFYARRDKGAPEFSAPVRVNSQPGSAVATGTI